MRFPLYLIFDYLTHGLWEFLANLPFAVFGYIVVHGIAKYIERHWRRWINPLYAQPFKHILRHRGSMADCEDGLCKNL